MASRVEVDDTAPYIAPLRWVVLCYQPSVTTCRTPPPLLLQAGCRRVAVLGCAGGLVVLPSLDAEGDAAPSFAWLQAALGFAGPDSNAERPIVPASPAAAYPPRYAGLRVRVFSSSAAACALLDQLSAEGKRSAAATDSSSGHHLLSDHPQLPRDCLTGTSPLPLVHFIQRCLDAPPAAGAGDTDGSASPNVLLFHIDDSSLLRPSLDESSLFLPPLLDQAVEQLHDLLYPTPSADPSPYSDVHLAILRLQSVPHSSSLPSTSPLRALVPRQSYQLAIPSASSTPSYLPLLSYHPDTTRSDRTLHVHPPTALSLGSGGLIAARDWLAEVAFKLGGKAKYGA